MMSLNRAARSLLGLALVALFCAALLAMLANRVNTQTPTGAAGGRGEVAADGAPSIEPPSPAAAPDAIDPRVAFDGYCVRESFVSLRELTPAELDALDTGAMARGSSGWLLDGGSRATGQGWVGDFEGAVAAYHARRLDRPGNWILIERDGKPMGISLREVKLPSGLVVWLPTDAMIPAECPD